MQNKSLPAQVWDKLSAINVNDHVDQKNGLTYLSWAWAWSEFKKAYPEATYEVVKNDSGLPYFESSAGAMVYTKVRVGEIEHEMWLPVMDGSNKAMKSTPYEFKTRNGSRTVDAYSMFDINKTIMRCLVKNLAMFGLGIYIYAGEDLPKAEVEAQNSAISKEQLELMMEGIAHAGINAQQFASACKVVRLDQLPVAKYDHAMGLINQRIAANAATEQQ